jgi:hypothetical protein
VRYGAWSSGCNRGRRITRITVCKREDTSLRTRLQRLKRTTVVAGCPACQDRPSAVLRLFRKDATGGAIVPIDRGGDDGEPSPACGWTPQVTKIVKVVVNSRDDLAWRKGLCGQQPTV